jgi:hypothetical protein
MATAVHAVPCQIQKPFPMMPLDVRAHLPVQLIEDFRADELIHDVHSRLDIIAKAMRRHVPGAVARLREASYDHRYVRIRSRTLRISVKNNRCPPVLKS